ncbi:hypothetical protein GTO91_03320 [Heliobacterium undosum]|uniref:Uncharacterized protein n=1 Tax=Heliomicrobium undosum TaxID=121734 RepID=A0A845L2K6_9FIRM|nr:hypothetical protein [Heliomicrobium undosum]MZP28740.1 hypothetical protein [Heliomicrobium undosum]
MTLHRWTAGLFTQLIPPNISVLMETRTDRLVIQAPTHRIAFQEPPVRLSNPVITVIPREPGGQRFRYRCGMSPVADVSATTIHYTTEGCQFNLFLQRPLHVLHGPTVSAGEWRTSIPILGSDALQGAIAAWTMAVLIGLPPDEAAKKLSLIRPPEGERQMVPLGPQSCHLLWDRGRDCASISELLTAVACHDFGAIHVMLLPPDPVTAAEWLALLSDWYDALGAPEVHIRLPRSVRFALPDWTIRIDNPQRFLMETLSRLSPEDLLLWVGPKPPIPLGDMEPQQTDRIFAGSPTLKTLAGALSPNYV